MATDSECRQALSDEQGYSGRPFIGECVGLPSYK